MVETSAPVQELETASHSLEAKQEPAVVCQALSKSFGPLAVLKGIDMTLQQKEIAAVIGPSGSGKSTLLHLIGLMEKPTSGRVVLFSRIHDGLSDEEASWARLSWIGFMFQFHCLLPELTVIENVILPCRLAGDALPPSEERALTLLERLGLSGRLAHRPHELSGGEQQRTALARALIRGPRLLLCDEPTGNLDRDRALQLQSLIWSESRRLGASVILATHNEALAAQADRIFNLTEGQVVEQ